MYNKLFPRLPLFVHDLVMSGCIHCKTRYPMSLLRSVSLPPVDCCTPATLLIMQPQSGKEANWPLAGVGAYLISGEQHDDFISHLGSVADFQ